MTPDQYTNIGRLKKTYGNDGAIRFTIFDTYEEDIRNTSHFFLHLEGIYVPFFFDKNAFAENIFRFKGIDSLEKTEELVSKPMFLSSEQVISSPKPKEALKFDYLNGFLLIDQEEKPLGKIEKIEAYPMQELATLDNGSILPLSDELIIKVDQEAKTVQMEVVEGLMAL